MVTGKDITVVKILYCSLFFLAEITERTYVPDERTATRSHRRRRSGQPKSNTVSKKYLLFSPNIFFQIGI